MQALTENIKIPPYLVSEAECGKDLMNSQEEFTIVNVQKP
jgi:hypothetical protein